MIDQPSYVLQVSGLNVEVKTPRGSLPLVHNIDFKLKAGRVLGIVGESGSGKSLTCLSIMQLFDRKTTRVGGNIQLKGRELNGLGAEEMRHVRGKEIGLIMQNPMNAFSPVFTIGNQFVETIRTHTTLTKKQAFDHAVTSLHDVHLLDPIAIMKMYPFQLSGGMLQRVMIAMSICLQPSVLIADEPTTALDAANQLQVLRQLDRLRSEYGTSILLISHDLGVIAEMADEVVVMQHGRIVEEADVFELFDHPKHIYTKQLLHARPSLPGNEQIKEYVLS